MSNNIVLFSCTHQTTFTPCNIHLYHTHGNFLLFRNSDASLRLQYSEGRML